MPPNLTVSIFLDHPVDLMTFFHVHFLCRQFSEAHKKEYYHYNEFLDAVENYELEVEDCRGKSAVVIFKKYLTRPDTSDSGVDTCENDDSTSGSGSLFIDRLDEETIKRVSDKLDSGERDLFSPCVKNVKALLSTEPFQEFLK